MRKDIVATTLWMMESAGDRALAISDIAAATGVSVFHLTRAFAAAIGISPARYLRMRRLTQAARVLARQDVPIVEVALGAGYASQEASPERSRLPSMSPRRAVTRIDPL